MVSIKVDIYEPQQIEALIQQSVPDTQRISLNQNNFADYLWYTKDGKPEQWERKQVTEILSGMEKVEYQLGKEIDDCPDMLNLILGIEGIVQPTPFGVQTFTLADNGLFFRKGKSYKIPYARYEGWIVAQERAGVLVWQTSSWLTTAMAIVKFASTAAAADTTALQRHLKVGGRDFKRNPYVETLMGLAGADLGPVLAEELIRVFKTPWDVLRQPPAVIAEYCEGIGIRKAISILKAAGRSDV